MESGFGIDDLLKPPSTFVRERYSSFLFAPFSRKLNRRVYLYTHDVYALWVRLESDPNVLKFNERVPDVPITIGTRAINATPRAISLDKSRIVTVHSFVGDLVSDDNVGEDKASPWEDWARAQGFSHKSWFPQSLRENSTEFSNLKRLLRYVSRAGLVPNIALQQAVLSELKSVRRIIFIKLVELFPTSDPSEVQIEIARLILDGVIYSDINQNPLSMITELSAHHAIETS